MNKILLIAIVIFITGCIEDVKKDVNSTKKEQNITKAKVSNKIEKKEKIAEVESVEETTTTIYTKEQSELKDALDIYLEQLRTLNTEGIVDMTYPNLFVPINKSMFKRYIDTLLTSEHITVDSFNTEITDIGEVLSYSGGNFAFVNYKSSIKLSFINPDLYNDELSIRVLNDVLKSKYGEENIQVDPQSRSITINKDEKLLCIKEKDLEWKFIGDNKEYRRLYPEILPPEILSQI